MSRFVSRNPEIMGGQPCFPQSRVPIHILFDFLVSGDSLGDFLGNFPTVSKEAAVGLLEDAKQALLREDALPGA